MFADLLKRLTAPAPEPANELDARLALGAILVRLARADGDYSATEKARISAILERRYGSEGLRDLINECEKLEAEAPDTVRFTRAIKQAVAYEDRLSVIRAMWEVVLVDGERDDRENSIMRMVAPMLGIEDLDSNEIRIEIENRQ